MRVHIDGGAVAAALVAPGRADVRHRLGVTHAAHVRRGRLHVGADDGAHSDLEQVTHCETSGQRSRLVYVGHDLVYCGYGLVYRVVVWYAVVMVWYTYVMIWYTVVMVWYA